LVTEAVVDRCLDASRTVGRTADFPTFAAEFALGPQASPQRKLYLAKKIACVERHYCYGYVKQGRLSITGLLEG